MNLLDFFDDNATALSVFTPLVVAVFSAFRFFVERHTEFTKPRYTSVVSPLFELAEPFMLRRGSSSIDGDAIRAILTKHAELSGGRLRRFIYADFSSNKVAFSFCRVISAEYDASCRLLGIPRRSLIYRFDLYHLRFCAIEFVFMALLYLGLYFLMLFATFYLFHLVLLPLFSSLF